MSGFPIFHRFIGDHRCVLTALPAANNVPDVSRGISVPLILVLLMSLQLVFSFCARTHVTFCGIDRFRQRARLFRTRARCRTVRGSDHPGVGFRDILNLAFPGSFRRVPRRVRICVPCNHLPTRYFQRSSTCNSTVSYAVVDKTIRGPDTRNVGSKSILHNIPTLAEKKRCSFYFTVEMAYFSGYCYVIDCV